VVPFFRGRQADVDVFAPDLAGSPVPAQVIINCGALGCLYSLLNTNHKKSIKKEVRRDGPVAVPCSQCGTSLQGVHRQMPGPLGCS
jgi:hypothetical protein